RRQLRPELGEPERLCEVACGLVELGPDQPVVLADAERRRDGQLRGRLWRCRRRTAERAEVRDVAGFGREVGDEAEAGERERAGDDLGRWRDLRPELGEPERRGQVARGFVELRAEDRKSVVEGKSVDVRDRGMTK